MFTQKIPTLLSVKTLSGTETTITLIQNECGEQAPLGEGKQGTVYKGVDQDKKLAVKLIKSYKSTIQHAKTEMAIMTTLTQANTPNTVHLYGYANPTMENNNHFIMAMTYMEKGCLYDWLLSIKEKKIQPSSGKEEKHIMQGLARGLAHIHAQEIIHCDIKPQNILLDNNLKPMWCDFGFSKRIGIDDCHNIAGSMLFFPPEILRGEFKPQTKKGDVYSFALICWCIAAHQPKPYAHIEDDDTLSEEEAVEALYKWVVVHQLREAFPLEIDEQVKSLITECWKNDMATRATAEQAVAMLETPITITSTATPNTNITTPTASVSSDLNNFDNRKNFSFFSDTTRSENQYLTSCLDNITAAPPNIIGGTNAAKNGGI